MKMRLVICALVAAAQALVAAPFQNLGFDGADTNHPVQIVSDGVHTNALGSAGDYIPGWQVSPLLPQGLVGLDQFPETGFGYATLFTDQGDFPPVEGRFSLDIVAGPSPPWTLTQTGDIPPDARTVNFLSYDAHFALTLDGVTVPLFYLPHLLVPTPRGLPPGYSREINDVYGDISAFAGKTVTLKLTTLIDTNSALEPDAGLDSIQFLNFPSKLAVSRFGKRLVVTWPSSTTNFVLQSIDAFQSTNGWQNVLVPPTLVGVDQIVSTNFDGAARVYRLIMPTNAASGP
jgi:hypothetical protein